LKTGSVLGVPGTCSGVIAVWSCSSEWAVSYFRHLCRVLLLRALWFYF